MRSEAIKDLKVISFRFFQTWPNWQPIDTEIWSHGACFALRASYSKCFCKVAREMFEAGTAFKLLYNFWVLPFYRRAKRNWRQYLCKIFGGKQGVLWEMHNRHFMSQARQTRENMWSVFTWRHARHIGEPVYIQTRLEPELNLILLQKLSFVPILFAKLLTVVWNDGKEAWSSFPHVHFANQQVRTAINCYLVLEIVDKQSSTSDHFMIDLF